MMTSRLRAAVSTEMKDRTMETSMSSDWGGVGFLQELLSSCGKQSSVPSTVSMWQGESAGLCKLFDQSILLYT